jgi:HK97 family phage major capsid protein
MKELQEKRQALLTELDKADEKRTAEIRAELEKIKLQIDTMKEIEDEKARSARPAIEKEAIKFNINSRPASEKRVGRFDTEEYRSAFMKFVKSGKAIPKELLAKRDDPAPEPDPEEGEDPEDLFANITGLSDGSAVIPSTLVANIISKLESYGEIYSRVTKTNIRGGVRVPILTLKPTASWVSGEGVSEAKKVQANSSVSFSYHTLECRIYQTLLSNVVTLAAFESKFVELAVEAIVKALEIAIFNGEGEEEGQPLGILADDRVLAANKVQLTAAELGSWDGWHKNVMSKMKKSYRDGVFIMAQSTFDSYIAGMVDTVGQPIARVTYGINGEENYRLFGKEVLTVEEDILPDFDTASKGDVFAVFIKLSDYVINSNLQMQTVKWDDHDTNQIKTKVIMIADGKLLDPNGVILIKKNVVAAG